MGKEVNDAVEETDDPAPDAGVDLAAPLADFFTGGLVRVSGIVRVVRVIGILNIGFMQKNTRY